MPTGRTITSTCAARAALAGNPSDGYGGAVVAIPIPDLCAMASATEAAEFSILTGDDDLHRLLTATADGFEAAVGLRPSVTLAASTSVPRSVGLAGSSALIIAALRALSEWTDHRWDVIELAELALDVERSRLGIEAGLQDRLVQAAGRPVAMTFEPVGYDPLEIDDDLPLFIAWSSVAAEPSDTLHRSLRRRFDAGDERVLTNLRELAHQAHLAASAIRTDDRTELARAMSASFDLRREMVTVDPRQIELIEVGRRAGAATNSAGSGGSIVGLAARHDDLDAIAAAYGRAGAEFLTLT